MTQNMLRQLTYHNKKQPKEAGQRDTTCKYSQLQMSVKHEHADIDNSTLQTTHKVWWSAFRCHPAWASVAPQWVTARTPTEDWGRYDGRPCVARQTPHATNTKTRPNVTYTVAERNLSKTFIVAEPVLGTEDLRRRDKISNDDEHVVNTVEVEKPNVIKKRREKEPIIQDKIN